MPPVLDTPERRAAATDAPPTRCPDETCESTELAWALGVRASHHAPGHGQLRLSDAVPRVVLVCTGCDEPLWVVEDDDELARFVVAPRPPIVINVTGRQPKA